MASSRKMNRYSSLLEYVFKNNYLQGSTEVPFTKDEFEQAAIDLDIQLPKNVPDLIYSFRYRTELPEYISSRAPKNRHWIIRGTGRAKYKFSAVSSAARVVPSEHLVKIKIPDSTPEFIKARALGDEQALLALVRYNRLIDLFLGITAHSLQNHLRTTVTGIGQVEVDEVYLAVDSRGAQYVIPVQAKGGTDQIGIVQIEQDLGMCAEKFPDLSPRPVAAQFMDHQVIALFELGLQDDEVVVLRERHYTLVPYSDISSSERELYARGSLSMPIS